MGGRSKSGQSLLRSRPIHPVVCKVNNSTTYDMGIIELYHGRFCLFQIHRIKPMVDNLLLNGVGTMSCLYQCSHPISMLWV